MADYVALRSIPHEGVWAYHAGDPVPAANVEVHSYQVGVDVARINTEGVAEMEEYDPAKHSVAEVNAYLDQSDDDEKRRVLLAERVGSQRRGILDGPHAKDVPMPDVAEA